MKPVLIYVICLVVLLGCDFAWLGTMTDILYRPNMQGLMSEQVNIAAAVSFYALYALGLSYLVIAPAVSADSPVNLVDLSLKAMVFGLAAYGTYDLTGLAVLKGWSLKLSLIDMAWGGVAAVISANATVFALRLLGQTR